MLGVAVLGQVAEVRGRKELCFRADLDEIILFYLFENFKLFIVFIILFVFYILILFILVLFYFPLSRALFPQGGLGLRLEVRRPSCLSRSGCGGASLGGWRLREGHPKSFLRQCSFSVCSCDSRGRG